MLDPKEQAKGGFRAQAERARERREQLAASAPEGGTTPPNTEDQADGAEVDAASETPDRSAPTAPGARRPRNFH